MINGESAFNGETTALGTSKSSTTIEERASRGTRCVRFTTTKSCVKSFGAAGNVGSRAVAGDSELLGLALVTADNRHVRA